jgi:hypothetical protein
VTILNAGGGLTAPAGSVMDPNVTLWVSDHIMGLCKVAPASGGSPGSLIPGASCAVPPPDVIPPPPPTRIGPLETTGLAFDYNENAFYVGGAGLAGGEIWRIAWNPMTGEVDPAASFQIFSKVDVPGEAIVGLSFDPAPFNGGQPVLDFTTKRTDSAFRVLNPGTCTDLLVPPGRHCTVAGTDWRLIGSTPPGLASGPLAEIGGFVYIGGITGLTRIPSPKDLGTSAAFAEPVVGGPPGPIGALAADQEVSHDGGRLYVGTAGIQPTDSVWAMAGGGTAEPVEYAIELDAVSSLSVVPQGVVPPEGSLVIADDPGFTPAIEETARLFTMAHTSLLVPRVAITRSPPAAVASSTVTVGFSSRAGITFECRIDPPAGNLQGGFTPCGTGPAGSREYSGLAEGVHRIEVRAVDPDPSIGAGQRRSVVFTVDLTAPTVRIENAASDHTPGSGNLDMRFTSDDPTAGFECSLDGSALAGCTSPHALRGVRGGTHQFRVQAVDGAGNRSALASWNFTVPAGAVQVSALRGARGPVTAVVRLVKGTLVIRIPAPRGAFAARIVIERKGVRRARNGLPSATKELAARVVRLRPGRMNVVRWTPRAGHTAAQNLPARLDLRHIRVLVSVGPSRATLGPARATVFSFKGRFWRLATKAAKR